MEHSKNNKSKFIGAISECISEITGYSSMIELISNNELVLSGCKSVLEYDCEEILVDTLSGNLNIRGTNLKLESFQGDILIIKGNIHLVNLEDYD